MEGELIKINPMDLPFLCKFTYEFLTIDPSAMQVHIPDTRYLRVSIKPKHLILSVHKLPTILSSVEEEVRKIVGMEAVQPQTIGCGPLSVFKPLEIPSEIRPKIALAFEREDKGIFKMQSVELDFGIVNKYSRYGVPIPLYIEGDKVLRNLKMLREIEGKNLDDYKYLEMSKVTDTLSYFLKGSLLIGNLFYNLFKKDFVSDMPLDNFIYVISRQGYSINEVFKNVTNAIKLIFGSVPF